MLMSQVNQNQTQGNALTVRASEKRIAEEYHAKISMWNRRVQQAEFESQKAMKELVELQEKLNYMQKIQQLTSTLALVNKQNNSLEKKINLMEKVCEANECVLQSEKNWIITRRDLFKEKSVEVSPYPTV